MLRKQKQITHDKYERLTTSSVSKRPASKRLQTTPGAERAVASEVPSSQKDLAEVRSIDLPQVRTPLKSQMAQKTPLKTPTRETVHSVDGFSQPASRQVETLQENGYNLVYAPYTDEVRFIKGETIQSAKPYTETITSADQGK